MCKKGIENLEEFQGIKAFRLIDGVLFTGGIGGSKHTKFKEGKTYTIEGEPELCNNGFHFYKTNNACFGTDLFGENTVFHEIIAFGKVIKDTEKCVATKIKIGKKINLKLDENSNSGNRNSGSRNSGYRNSGDCNSGDRNSGNYNSGSSNSGNYNSGNNNSGYSNSGNRNSGHYNSGHWNSGSRNSGDRNSGNRNSGHYNFGNWNSGHYNSGHCNSGNGNSGYGYRNYFCKETKYFLFDLEVTEESIDRINKIPMFWFDLKNKSYKEAWAECPEEILNEFRQLPELQTQEAKEIFKDITGLKL